MLLLLVNRIACVVSFAATLGTALVLGVATGAGAESLEYDLATTAFTSSADYTQPQFSPDETHDGNIEAAAPPYDGWAVDPFHGDPHQILWAFVAGETSVDAIQLIHVYNDDEVLHHFQLYYTTDSNPSLASTFQELTGLQMVLNTSGDGAIISGSEVQVTSTTSITTGEYRLSFDPVNATAIQLRTFANSGTGNGNFVLSEVSMRSSIPGGTDHRVYLAIDTDDVTTTGCDWSLEEASRVTVVGGVERVVVATVDASGSAPQVSKVEIQNCEGAGFGVANQVAVGGWLVGQGTGVSGSNVVEFAVPTAKLGGGPMLRLYAGAQSAGGERDALATADGTLGGDPILVSLVTAVPGLDGPGWLATAAVILALGAVLLRHRSTCAIGGLVLAFFALRVAGAITLGLDGQVADWTATSPAALDAVGDSTGADANADLVALFAEVDASVDALAVRIDVVSLGINVAEIPGMAFVPAGAFEMGCRLNAQYEAALSNPPQNTAEFTAFDDFARSDSEVLGTTPRGNYTWVETADGVGPETGSRIQITDESAAIHYFLGGGPTSPVLQANLAGLSARNVDLTVRFKCSNATYCTLPRTFGQSWRLGTDSGDYDDLGYHLQIGPDPGASGLDPGIHLYAGSTLLKSASVAIDNGFHTYRTVSVGPTHKVYFDDVLQIDSVDSRYPGAGFVGVGGYFSIVQFDDFGVADLGPSMIHSDTQCGANEHPTHTVTLSDFYIDRNEVTAAEYKACVDAGGCTYTGAIADERRTYGVSGREDYPINYVSWQDAVDYCTWSGKRLPTEAEWEKAARGIDGRIYPWGDSPVPNCSGYAIVALDGIAGCGGGKVLEVGQQPFGISPYGAHDMIGNVQEWTADWYASDFYCAGSGGATSSPYAHCVATDNPHADAATNPTGPASGSGKVRRGGSYVDYPNAVDYEHHRVSGRSATSPVLLLHDSGFRCAL